MIKATVKKHDLKFIHPGTTSRGTLYTKPSWFICFRNQNGVGIGECSVIPGLNPEYDSSYETKIREVVDAFKRGGEYKLSDLDHYPSIQFGLEQALLGLKGASPSVLFPSDFTQGKKGIPINGLIWMGSREKMEVGIRRKLQEGFKVLKLKVGALEFDQELEILSNIRKAFLPEDLEIRLDANGAFQASNVLEKLHKLSEHAIHSIEQPIRQGQWEVMATICKKSPIPIALDEELIGVVDSSQMESLLKTIAPQFIILKPSLVGGFGKSDEWIRLAEKYQVEWWSTSALESNVGLNAISQWVFMKRPGLVQGLGTGQLYSNNLSSPLNLRGPKLFYDPEVKWDHSLIFS
ncbi:MAG: o-succinylbenzoate synthase [Saprospirales bacterium]|nr:MAG: o-succinylbenzoate synthase [Saprospirales bacterium]